MTEADIPTPALVVDEVIVDRNLRRMAAYCSEHRLQLRPHTKTHKSLKMAGRQLALGASGLTAAKLGEAEVFATIGADLLIGYPSVEPQQATRLAELAKVMSIAFDPVRAGSVSDGRSPADPSLTLRARIVSDIRLSRCDQNEIAPVVCVAVDSSLSVDVISAAATAAGATVGLLVDLDVGFHRTGVQTPADALALARHIARLPGVRLDGLFCFPGHVSMSPALQADPLAQVSAALRETLQLWQRDGHGATIVSGGSTPTALQSHLVPELTEIRPGTYIYNDRNCIAGGWATVDDCAARVLATVVSTAVPGKCVINAGSKSLTTDRLAKDPIHGGFGLVVEYPEAKIVRLSEEHGEIDLSGCEKRPALGERVHVIPNHVCPCVNLHDSFWLRSPERTLELMPVDARGKVA